MEYKIQIQVSKTNQPNRYSLNLFGLESLRNIKRIHIVRQTDPNLPSYDHLNVILNLEEIN